MKFENAFAGRGKKIAVGVAAVAVVAGATTGSAVAAKQITSSQIKDGTIQTRDLTKNNFARFTSTETVVNGVTPVNPSANNKRVVPVAAGANATPLAQVVLNRGTYRIEGVAQFTAGNTGTPNYGEVTVSYLSDSFSSFVTGPIPGGGANPAQAAFSGTVTITADNTPVVVYGHVADNSGGTLAGAEISANQYKYVKLFKGGTRK